MKRRVFPPSYAEHKRGVRRALAFMAPDGQIPGEVEKHLPSVAAKRMAVRHEREGLSELQHGIRYVSWWDKTCHEYGLPPYALIHIPNGGGRGAIEASNLKRSGVRPGVEDYALTVPRGTWHGLFVELKILGGVISEDQKKIAAFHFEQGYQSHVAWSHQEAIEYTLEYLSPQI